MELTEQVFRAIAEEAITDDVIEANSQIQSLRHSIQQAIRGMLGLNMRVTLVPPSTIPRSEGGKLRRTVDLRNL